MSLISVDELAALLADPDRGDPAPVVCDVRFHLDDHDRGRRDHLAGHVPGARFVDLHTELAGGSGGGRHPLPPVGEFRDLLGRLGISPATFVVAYDDAGGAIASRLWWMLRSIGHGRVAVLDGGYPAWTAAGHPISTELADPAPTVYPPVPDWTGTLTGDDVAEAARLGMAAVIDARSPERYRGEVEPIDPRAGHIPGAVNRFHGDNLDANGYHRPVHELAERFAGLGSAPIVYCGSGVTACHDLLAMSLVGLAGARLYPGSWSEWSSDPTREIVTGSDPR